MAAIHLLPLAALCLLLFLAASAVVVPAATATAGDSYYGGGARMVVITRGTGARVISGAAGGARSHNKWRHHRRLVEDEVAPELVGGMLGATDRSIGYNTLNKDRPAVCQDDNCAAKAGDSYTRGCKYEDRCAH